MSTTMTIRLESDLKQRLEALAEATHRSKSFLANEALNDFLEHNEWQIEQLKEAVEAADRGEFASDEEVASTFSQWGVDEN